MVVKSPVGAVHRIGAFCRTAFYQPQWLANISGESSDAPGTPQRPDA
jgi:hypothetical protein